MKEIIVDGNSAFGINYYHESMGYAPWSEEDLIRIKKVTNKIKLFKHPYGRNDYILEICQKCKELGFYVILGENFDGNHYAPPYSPGVPYIPYKLLTEEHWITYCNYIKTDYEVLKDYVDEFLVSNEISIHTDKTDGMKGQNLIDKNVALMNELKEVQDCNFGIQEGYWQFYYRSSGYYDYSDFDKLYFTSYAVELKKFEGVINKMKLVYPDGMIGEWNISLTPVVEDWEAWALLLKARKDLMKKQGISNFIFTYHAGGHSVKGDEVFNKMAKTIHYCDHDLPMSQRKGCIIKLEDLND